MVHHALLEQSTIWNPEVHTLKIATAEKEDGLKSHLQDYDIQRVGEKAEIHQYPSSWEDCVSYKLLVLNGIQSALKIILQDSSLEKKNVQAQFVVLKGRHHITLFRRDVPVIIYGMEEFGEESEGNENLGDHIQRARD